MSVEIVEGCLMCGIHRSVSKHPDCKTEAKEFHIDLVDIPLADHIWVEMKIAKDWYFKGIEP